MRHLYFVVGGAVEFVPTFRADYRYEGKSCLGRAALWFAPLAFLGGDERAKWIAEFDFEIAKYLPPAMTLAEAAIAVSKED